MLACSWSRSTASGSHAVPAQPSLPPRSATMGIERVYIHRCWSALRSVALLAEQPCAPHSGSPRCQISNLRRCASSPSLLLWASAEPASTPNMMIIQTGGKDRTSGRTRQRQTDRQADCLCLSVCLSVNTCIISCVLSQSAPSVRTEPRRCELLQRARCSEALVLRSSVHLQ
jgi:hypothetical protein